MPFVKWLLLALLVVSCGLTERKGRGDDGNQVAGGAVGGVAGGAAGDRNGLDLAGEGGRAVDGTAGTDGATDFAGAAGQPSPDPADPLGPLSPSTAVCDGYLSAWRLRSSEQSSDVPGACYQCLGNQPACFDAWNTLMEGQYACFLRNCLCDPVNQDCASFDYPADACACFGSCLPEAPHPARQGWLDYMTCEVENCSAACQ